MKNPVTVVNLNSQGKFGIINIIIIHWVGGECWWIIIIIVLGYTTQVEKIVLETTLSVTIYWKIIDF